MVVRVLDVSGVTADAAGVDALARLQLAARRCGATIRLANASRELLELVAFMGLGDVLPGADAPPATRRRSYSR